MAVTSELHDRILTIPEGYSEVRYQDRKYGLRRTDFNGGKSLKVYAEELGGNDFISFNYYITRRGGRLKPCEMPEAKVRDFLETLHASVFLAAPPAIVLYGGQGRGPVYRQVETRRLIFSTLRAQKIILTHLNEQSHFLLTYQLETP